MVNDFDDGVGFCVFWKSVKCVHRKKLIRSIMQRCFKCPEYLKFSAESDEEEEREDALAEEILSGKRDITELYP
jgi:hypothetical protein